ncbi:MAG: endonuclease Q family protein [Symbiobacterium sp.]|uniref:endonuclease Q family protein n=1 Tax=Symbiobacterium sp. TaxID=1971213 RepID=UPI0034646B73
MPGAAAAEPLQVVYADLHVHLGWAGDPGGPVKIAAARSLTLEGILAEARDRKGIRLVGVIDAATGGGLADLERLVAEGRVSERPGGGLAYDEVTLIPGAEVEVVHGGRPVHLLCYFRGLEPLRAFAGWQAGRVRNRQLSTQRLHGAGAPEVVATVAGLGGVVIPAHIFTPHKSALGAAPAISEVIPPDLWGAVPAVELGLSADTALADEIPELSRFPFLANSDAHSLGRIGREYNQLLVAEPSFDEWLLALRGERGRAVLANYGLDPRLGKYHRTFCLTCGRRVEGDPPVLRCSVDPHHRVVLGVLDRIRHYRAWQEGRFVRVERERPPYVHQVPLSFVPGLGRRGLERLVAAFGTEMAVLHRASEEELAEVVGARLARLVVLAREGRLDIESGGGGVYGRVIVCDDPSAT